MMSVGSSATPVPEGKGIEVVGEVVKTDGKTTEWGFRMVMTVASPEGWRVWGTIPQALSAIEPGEWIKFVANLERGDRDPAFGFFKRPRKCERLDAEPEAPSAHAECVTCGASLEDTVGHDECPECRNIPF